MKKINIFLIIIILIFASSNITSIDISSELYPTGMALDYDKDNNEYILYFQVVNPSFLAKNENIDPSSKDSTFAIKQNGDSFYSCYNKLNSITKKRISLRHIQSFILSKNFLELDSNIIHDLFILLVKNTTLPANIYLYATSENIDDIYNNQNILDESSYYSILNNPQDSNIGSIIYPNTLLQISRCILDNKKMYYIPSVYLDENIETTNSEGEVKKNKVININGVYFTTINEYKFTYLTLDKINGFHFLYSRYIDTLEINDIDNKYYLKIHNIKSTYKINDENNILILKLNDIDLICPLNSIISDVKNVIINNIYNNLYDLYNLSLSYNIDIFNIFDLRYRYKKSLNINDLTINIKTSFQNVQYYASTTT